MKRVAILGSTGSIGVQTLDVCKFFTEDIEIVGLSTNSNIEKLSEQVSIFKPKSVCITDKEARKNFHNHNNDLKIYDDLLNFVEEIEIDLLVTAVVGSVGLRPTLSAINKKNDVALANKETLVMAGKFVMEYAIKNNVNIFPIDSEHSAIWQSLRGNTIESVENLWITCSGGPFFGKNRDYLHTVSKEQALNHPTWKMGGKITVDSATLMNKGLEVIEAYHLFKMPIENIKVVIHPQSIIHSIVEYKDGNYISQMGAADMRIPIQYALFYPDRKLSNLNKLDLYDLKNLTFSRPDLETFTPLSLAYECIKMGGVMPTILNASNEILVMNFLNNRIKFIDIFYYLEKMISISSNIVNPSIEDIIYADEESRKKVIEIINK